VGWSFSWVSKPTNHPPWRRHWWQLLWILVCCGALVAAVTWTSNLWTRFRYE